MHEMSTPLLDSFRFFTTVGWNDYFIGFELSITYLQASRYDQGIIPGVTCACLSQRLSVGIFSQSWLDQLGAHESAVALSPLLPRIC